MVAKRSSRALALLLVMPSAAFALGFGDIRLLSPLNAPLDAEIDLVDVTPEELGSLKAQIASRDTFVQHGLDWPAFLGSVRARAERNKDGREVIKLTSTESVTEPFLTLLVEVDWARGRQVREYTVLLDPPVFTPKQAAGTVPVAVPSAGGGAHEGAITRSAPASAPAPAAAVAPASPSPSTSTRNSAASSGKAASKPTDASSAAATGDGAAATHLVKPGETLSAIASTEASSGPTSAQTHSWMLAIYQANPRAFEQNMNLLRSGAVLRMPNAAAVAAVSPGEAAAEIRRQYAAWRETAPTGTAAASGPGSLHLVSPGQPGASGTGAPSSEVKALQGQVHDLEGQLSEQKRLLEMRNAELADLQSRLAAQQGGRTAPSQPAAPPAQAPAAEASAAAANPPEPAAAPAPAEAAPPPVRAAAAAHKPPVHKPGKPAVVASESGGSILDTLKDYWWALAALAVAILAYVGVKTVRSRRQSDFDDSLSRLAVAGADSSGRGFAAAEAPAPAARAVQPARGAPEDAFLVEESGSHRRSQLPGETPAATARHVASDDTISSDTAINLDQGDPLAEADFHMAYGLYDQAADLIRIAISREPARRDLKLKLLEVFFVWGNKDQFLQSARELAQTRADAAPGEWEKIVIMGKQLAPEDPLFSSGDALTGATAGGVDLNLEGGQSRVDFDLMGEPVPGEPGEVDLDIGSALAETGSAASFGGETDRNAAIDHSFTGAATATTRQMTQKIASEAEPLMPDFGTDPEAPTVEQPAMASPDNPTIRQKVEFAMRQNSAEQTAELAIDDLGLDLGALDTLDQPGLGNSPDAPTLVAGLDDHSRRIMEDAERRAGNHDIPSATGTWHMDATELHSALGARANGAGGHEPQESLDSAATSHLEALDPQEVDYDLGEINGAPHGTNGSGVDLDIGAATVPDTAFASTQRLASDDLALPDLEPVTMSEVGTKLDLARAYMDMGDPDGARNILEEVLTEGSSTQKQEAQRLMGSLPG